MVALLGGSRLAQVILAHRQEDPPPGPVHGLRVRVDGRLERRDGLGIASLPVEDHPEIAAMSEVLGSSRRAVRTNSDARPRSRTAIGPLVRRPASLRRCRAGPDRRPAPPRSRRRRDDSPGARGSNSPARPASSGRAGAPRQGDAPRRYTRRGAEWGRSQSRRISSGEHGSAVNPRHGYSRRSYRPPGSRRRG